MQRITQLNKCCYISTNPNLLVSTKVFFCKKIYQDHLITC